MDGAGTAENSLDTNLRCYGTVHLMDWISSPVGQVRGITGDIEIVSDEDGVGFRARGANSANWLAKITGPTQVWYVFGCQIRTICSHPTDAQMLVDVWKVT